MVEGGGFEPPKLTRQIYSLIPLATREPLQKEALDSAFEGSPCQMKFGEKRLLALVSRGHRPISRILFRGQFIYLQFYPLWRQLTLPEIGKLSLDLLALDGLWLSQFYQM